MKPPPPAISIAGRVLCSFHLFGVAGVAAAALALILVGAYIGLSLAVLSALFTLACVTFLALAQTTKWIVGHERLVYYHHEIAILLVSSAALTLVGLPAAPHLDAIVIALGAFLFFGRVGCSAVGCCYGRPVAWGWRYGPAHSEAGFTPALCGVSLCPVQWFEAAGVLIVTVSAALLIRNHAPPGSAATLYLTAYAALRFALEFCRGDRIRRRWGAWTEAQWTSVVVFTAVTWPVAPPLAVVVCGASFLAGCTRTSPRLDVRQLGPLAARLREPYPAGQPLVHQSTSGLRLSKGELPAGTRIYVASTPNGPLSQAEALTLSTWIACLEQFPSSSIRIIHRPSGVTAFLLPPHLPAVSP